MMKKFRFIFLCVFLIFNNNLTAQDSLMTIGTNFWDQAWGGADPWKLGYQNAIDADKIADPAYNPWKTEFIDEIAFYSVLRFMDYGRINNNQSEVNWSDRTKKEDANQGRMALYWMIDLCNRAQADLWVCMPEKASAGYWQGAAQLIKDHLDPQLKVYIEWSNETWNPQFTAYQTGIDSGKVYDLWFPGDQGQSWGEQRLSGRYTAWVNVRIWQNFQDVFGHEFNTRVVTVLAGAAGNDWWDAVLANALSDSKINPGNLLPDVFAIAPYVGVDNGAAQDVIDKMYTQMNQSENNIKKVRGVLNGTSEWAGQMPPHPGLNNIPMICYEAGQHIVVNSASFAVNPEAYDWYMDYLDMLQKYIRGPVAHYTHSGTWGNMAWGAKSNIGQPAGAAPKFIALNNWHILNVQPDPDAEYELTVTNGSGSGSFYSGMYAFIEADPGDSLVFLKWSGDTTALTDMYSAQTTALIRNENLTFTAIFRETGPVTRFEAEDAGLTGVEISSARGGYSGAGYIDGGSFDADGDKITFHVTVQDSGNYFLRIGYGGFYGDKHQYIDVNGERLAYFPFPQTSDWAVIDFGMIALKSGSNLVEIVKSWGWMDVDFIEIEGEGIVSIGDATGMHLPDFQLYDNFPNPFNPRTIIKYHVESLHAASQQMDLSVYNLLGQKIETLFSGKPSPGLHEVVWDTSGKTLASGIYIYRLKSEEFMTEKRMVLLK